MSYKYADQIRDSNSKKKSYQRGFLAELWNIFTGEFSLHESSQSIEHAA